MTDLTNLSARINALRKDVCVYFGGVIFQPISKEFGIYKMIIPEKEAFMRYAEHHFIELEKMFKALTDSSGDQPGDEK